MQLIDMQNVQRAIIDLHPVDDGGNPRALDGAAQWVTPDPTQVAIENLSADGLHAELVPADNFVGEVICTASDVDGAPTEAFKLTVTSPGATSLGATVQLAPK